MTEKRLRRRTPLRFKQIKAISSEIEARLNVDLNLSSSFLEEAHFEGVDLIVVDRLPRLMKLEKEEGGSIWFPTLRGLLTWGLDSGWAEVDHGAIPFLMNGADCMAAGIQNSDHRIKKGDLVWIRDESHRRPLALGWALMDGEEMERTKNGKGIRTVHWIGDDLWSLDS
ncbi:MAG: PUA domain-containing protein [Candidatus Thermoplasmatota archaeon]|mgnify:FL=1|nr:PUA domain-containing protein [Candidatus Thermoplasmatota archaeon]MED5306599.1 PUA domain-containing protein [Candidatus Thermoplasmatota archaeon]